MSASKSHQISARKALDFEEQELGVYKASIHSGVCFGVVVSGGIVTALAQRCAKHFCQKSNKTASHKELWRLSVNFFRPTLAIVETILKTRIANSNKLWTTVHVGVEQNGKICLEGTVTLTDMSKKGTFTKPTGWQLSPPSVPANLEEIKNDTSPTHFGYNLKWESTSFRKGATYMNFYLPKVQRVENEFDQWATPAWKDDELPDGAVWDNNLLHYLIDTSLPITNSLIRNPKTPNVTWHEALVRDAMLQREARQQGRSDAIVGEGTSDETMIPYIFATVAMTTEQIKPVPEGCKWLFVRASARTLIDDRMNMDVTVLDEEGNLVAVSNHIMQVVPSATKNAKKPKNKAVL